MDKKTFLDNVRLLFDETDPSLINMDTRFNNLEEWCSLVGLALMAMVEDHYGVKLTLLQLTSVVTVNDLFNLVYSQKTFPHNA